MFYCVGLPDETPRVVIAVLRISVALISSLAQLLPCVTIQSRSRRPHFVLGSSVLLPAAVKPKLVVNPGNDVKILLAQVRN